MADARDEGRNRAGLRARLIGPFGAWRDGEPIAPSAWGRRRTQALFKLLACRRGQVLTQEQLVEWLFPDLAPDKALQNLHARVSELRRALEPGLRRGADSRFVRSEGKGRYRLSETAPCWIDLEAFEQALDAAARAEREARWDEAVAAYERAAALAEGELLAEERYAPWAEGPRRRFAERAGEALTRLAELHARRGTFERAVACARAALERDPYREAAHRQLIRCHARAAEPGKAAQAFRDCERALAELGAEPDAETRALAERAQRGEAARAFKSIAVLPFVQLSSRQAHTVFSDGLTEDLIAQLARVRDLKVIAPASALRYKHTRRSRREIGAALGVGAVLEGSVRTQGGRVRVAARLVEVDSDETRWAEIYDRELTDIFAIQSELARQIAAALHAEVSAAERRRLDQPHAGNLDAYHLYLKGRYFWNKRTGAQMEKAVACFRGALERDPAYAPAWAGLADAHATLAWFGYRPPQTFAEARAAALRALELDPDSAEALTPLAHVRMNHDWDWRAARVTFERALELNPNYPTARQWYAELLAATGEVEAAVEQVRTALTLDPLSLTINTVLGWKLVYARRGEEAVAQCERALELDPDFGPARAVLGLAYESLERHEDALREFRAELDLVGPNVPTLASLGYLNGRLGRRGAASSVLKQFDAWKGPVPVSPFHRALVHLGLGAHDAALDELERGLEERTWLLSYLGVGHRWDPLRNEPRYRALLAAVGLASEVS